jgi:3-hydroxyacyl-CoA dehydrogenase/3a,7a,12a-trihydroxy-5b-cholest-24-enoyl-CoA hydratase
VSGPPIRFDGQVAIVTGAGGGLGRAYALEFARRGARVVVNDLGGSLRGEGASGAPAEAVVAEIVAQGGEAIASLASVEAGQAIVAAALDAFGRVDILVNNAGILRDSSFRKMTDDDWNRVIAVHLTGAYAVTRAAWPHMIARGHGRIVNTASAAGIYGNFGQANYAAAKLGLVGLTRTLAIEGASKGVTANAIAPIAGSRLLETISSPEMVAALKPEHVVPLVMRLCAPANGETGGLFEVGAGWMAKLRWERARGVAFNPAAPISAEMVDAAWERLADFTDAEHPADVREAAAPIRANLGLPPRAP